MYLISENITLNYNSVNDTELPLLTLCKDEEVVKFCLVFLVPVLFSLICVFICSFKCDK